MGYLFAVKVEGGEITVHSTESLGDCSGFVVTAPVDLENANLKAKVGSTGMLLLKRLYLHGLHGLTRVDFFTPYHIRIQVGGLFDIGPMHKALENFIFEKWSDAEITGDRYKEAQAFIGFEITSGPSRDDILRVLDGNHPEGDPTGWEALQFTGHKPGSDEELILVVYPNKLLGRRDLKRDQGERIVWDLFPGAYFSIGPAPTAEHLRRRFHHPDAQRVHGAFVRFHDATGTGLVLDKED